MNTERLRELVENVLYPELVTYGRTERTKLLQEASKEPFDFIETIGMWPRSSMSSVSRATASLEFGLVNRIAVALANFLMAVPLLVVTVGPFLVRRTRRGLQSRRR